MLNSRKDAVDYMGSFISSIQSLDIQQTTKFKCLIIYRDALVEKGFDLSEANKIALKTKIEIDEIFMEEYGVDIEEQMKGMASAVYRIYMDVKDEFGINDVNEFMDSFGSDLSYQLTY